MTDERVELKPCPFCGRAPRVFDRARSPDCAADGRGDRIYFAVCHCAGHSAGAHKHGYSDAQRAEAWNTRAAIASMSTPDGELEGRARELAQRFHETYERLAPSFGYETRKESAKPWVDVPDQNRRLMIAVCQELLSRASLPSTVREEVLEEAAKVAEVDHTPGYGPHREDMESLADTQRRNIAPAIRALKGKPTPVGIEE